MESTGVVGVLNPDVIAAGGRRPDAGNRAAVGIESNLERIDIRAVDRDIQLASLICRGRIEDEDLRDVVAFFVDILVGDDDGRILKERRSRRFAAGQLELFLVDGNDGVGNRTLLGFLAEDEAVNFLAEFFVEIGQEGECASGREI